MMKANRGRPKWGSKRRVGLRLFVCVAVAAASIIFLTGLAEADTHHPPPAVGGAALVANLRSDLSQYLAKEMQTEHLSALSLRVVVPGNAPSINVAVGTTQYGGNQPISTAATWQIGSNTKAFTAVIMLQLEAEGRLSIDDTLGRWLPQYPQWKNVTIRQLLNMTSGIPDYADTPAFQTTIVANQTQAFTSQQLVSYVYGQPLLAGWNYSNTNYVLAQMVIENVTHDSFVDQLARRITIPLGLQNLCFAPEGCTQAEAMAMPDGYNADTVDPILAPLFGTPVPNLGLSWAKAAGANVSTLADVTTWDKALYGGELLPPRQQQELESLVSEATGEPTGPGMSGFGLGVALAATAAFGPVWDYEGETFGFRVLTAYQPSSRVTLALAANSGPVADSDHLSTLAVQVLTTLESAGVVRAG
jgi:D-alanyl-D-alanine carboxypeptidase